MNKIGDFFSTTRRERVGTFVVLLLLAVAVLYSYCSRQNREHQGAQSQPSEQVMQALADSVAAQPLKSPKDSTSKKSNKKRKKRKKRKKKAKSTKTSKYTPHSGNAPMEELPTF